MLDHVDGHFLFISYDALAKDDYIFHFLVTSGHDHYILNCLIGWKMRQFHFVLHKVIKHKSDHGQAC